MNTNNKEAQASRNTLATLRALVTVLILVVFVLIKMWANTAGPDDVEFHSTLNICIGACIVITVYHLNGYKPLQEIK